MSKLRPGEGGGGGLGFSIHHSLPFSPINCSFNTDDKLEIQGINILLNGSETAIFNVYLPPPPSCPPRYTPNLRPLLDFIDDGDAFVLGDFNAHHRRGIRPSRTTAVVSLLTRFQIALLWS